MKKHVLFILIAVIAYSCNNNRYNYPNDLTLSSREGARIDSTANYLPSAIEFEGNSFSWVWNDDQIAELNNFYTLTSEPLLYNFYLNRNIYRLVLVEEGKKSLLISINKGREESWIVSKRINLDIPPAEAIETDSIDLAETLLISKFDNYSRPLNTEEVQAFDSIFHQFDFYHLENNLTSNKYNSYYLLESHEKDAYWCIYRPLEDEAMKKIASYMRGLTGF